jgi:hypothetical protein
LEAKEVCGMKRSFSGPPWWHELLLFTSFGKKAQHMNYLWPIIFTSLAFACTSIQTQEGGGSAVDDAASADTQAPADADNTPVSDAAEDVVADSGTASDADADPVADVDAGADTAAGYTLCQGDELIAEVPISSNMKAFKQRYQDNRGLLRLIVIGGPN